MNADANETTDDMDEVYAKKSRLWAPTVFFVIFAVERPRGFGSDQWSAKRRVYGIVKVFVHQRRRVCVVFWKSRNCQFSVVAVLKLGYSRSGFGT